MLFNRNISFNENKIKSSSKSVSSWVLIGFYCRALEHGDWPRCSISVQFHDL